MDNNFYLKNLNEIYNNSGYFKRYGLDVWLTIIIIVIMLSVFAYFHTLNNLRIIRANWDTEKCNPLYFPLVPLINPDPNKPAGKQISDHFETCINNGIKDITTGHVSNMFDKMNIFNSIFNEFGKFSSFFSSIIKTLLTQLMEFIEMIINIVLKFLTGITQYLIKIKDLFYKFLGIILTGFYILLELINICIGIVLNFATILTVTVVTPLTITFVSTLLSSIVFFAIAAATAALAIFGVPEFFIGIAVVFLATAVSTGILIAIALVFGGGLIDIQNRAKKKAFAAPIISDTSRN